MELTTDRFVTDLWVEWADGDVEDEAAGGIEHIEQEVDGVVVKRQTRILSLYVGRQGDKERECGNEKEPIGHVKMFGILFSILIFDKKYMKHMKISR